MIQIRASGYRGTIEQPLVIGRLREHDVRTVVFDLEEFRNKLGTGSWEIVAQRPYETVPYPVSKTWESEEGYACWDVSEADVGIAGNGRVELRYYPDKNNNPICKSQVWITKIEESIGVTGDAPNPYKDLIDEVIEARDVVLGVVPDGELSETSAHPVENRVVTNAINSNTSAINIQRARIDSLITGGTSIDPDAELADIRIGVGGATYDSAGTAVRTQITDLDSTLRAYILELIRNVEYEVDGKADEEYVLEQISQIEGSLNGKVDNAYVEDGYLYLTGNDEIVAGPLGPFSGGGGGGGSSSYSFIVRNTSGWTTKTIPENGTCKVSLTWSSVEEELETGNGALKLYVGNILRSSMDVAQGALEIDVSRYLTSGSNPIRITITDISGTTKALNLTVAVIVLSVSSSFDYLIPREGEFTFTYVPTGAVDKTAYILVDGKVIGTQVVKTSGRQQSFTIPAQRHGEHNISTYFEAEIDGETVRSNTLYFDVICIESGNNTPIISSGFNKATAEQYTTLDIKYMVYTPNSLNSRIQISVNGSVISEQTVDRTEQTLLQRLYDTGTITISISTGSVSKTFTVEVTESSIDARAETENLSLYLAAIGRSNNEMNPAIWTFEDIASTFNGFNFVSDGWINNALRLSGDARLTINHKPFENDFRQNGKTIGIEFATSDVRDYDAVIFSCMYENVGIKITAQMAVLKSEQSTISMQFKENEHVSLYFVIEKRSENRLIYCYINGIMSGVIQYPTNDDFSQSSPVYITAGSNSCTMDIYNIRIYDTNLTRYQILENWIADSSDIDDMIDRYNRNNIYDDYGNIVISKLPIDLPYMIISCGELPQYKGDKKTVDISYIDPVTPSNSFTSGGVQLDVQGTSSQYYARKNYKAKFKKGFVYNDATTSSKYKLREDSIAVSTFTFKADVASSEGANNVELVRLYDNICPYKTPAQIQNNKVRQGIDGFPMVVFWNDGESTSFLGKYNFNNDKGTEEVFGFVDGDESWEIRNNTSDRVIWKSDDYTSTYVDTDGKTKFDWLNDFEARFPDTDPAYENPAQLSEFASWVKSTDTEQATNELLPSPVTYVMDNEEVTYVRDTAEYRLAKFRNEAGNYMEINSAIFYYLFTELFLMVDSRAKNAFPSFIGTEVG